MRFIQGIAVAVLALAASGCATKWERSGATSQDLAADRAFCENTAEKAFADRDEGRLRAWETALDKRGAFERCMMAHGWGVKV